MNEADCIIDQIVAGKEKAYVVFEDEQFIAFLDHHPLFPGHVLLSPKTHIANFDELPIALVEPLFILAQKLSKAIIKAMQASGSFIATNNKVSQSIPHLHIHIVPRNKGDGLKGFFWPRQRYRNDAHLLETQRKIIDCLKET
ncbi:Histidine triad (HIT) protein [Legionella quinlivanii]|uniref:Histidine triad (HIT) protein n=1 Tax=Legionella quinlivanii TaxID=45073 RepID=A0A0W0Y721_9GAMM|nr:HIT family protein [Legionella quinlivanii]KTD52544.1 Histidine triad (HIT) protein [Legionella quinlivanii]SEG44032.1 histidine triad (HIT) family protein [Legionella quinlivanii DSM 21216]STY09742.1 Histidine triad (HIT) protein [Legionella quinlivanii]